MLTLVKSSSQLSMSGRVRAYIYVTMYLHINI